MLQDRSVEAAIGTIECIVASPYVTEFMIGYTANAGRQRLSGYWQLHGYQYLVIVVDRLTRDAALNLEKRLQAACWKDKRSLLYRKYAKYARGKRHYPSAGQKTVGDDDLLHSVYVAWWYDAEKIPSS